ncbi:hypothetical protein PVAP13_1KG178577 [Panicum virgatum]|uniref:Uncharacterized protein n=1 Tax=Panicum virgatum TaxID=38727 RepID=A0A8T0XD37_PANVG|nr:hypothetical protein PVAP13_1KG178577 [Panicum virgatum]
MKRINGGLLRAGLMDQPAAGVNKHHVIQLGKSIASGPRRVADRTHSPSPVPFIPHYSFVWLSCLALDTCLFHATFRASRRGS